MRLSVTRAMGVAAVITLVAACGPSGGDDAAEGAPAAGDVAAAPAESHAAHHSAAPPPPAAPLRAGERFLQLDMPRPYLPKPPTTGSTDDYRCFLVDPGFTAPTFLVGSQFLPQNPKVVHHAIFFRVPAADVAEAERLDADGEDDGWTCFGGTGIGGPNAQARQLSNAPWVAAWAPGAGESTAAEGTGNLMEPGSRLVMQVHYNLLATNGKPAGTDRSGIRLRLAPGNASLEPLKTRLLTAPIELPCPPDEQGKLCDRDLAVWDVIRRFGDEAGFTVAGLNMLCNNSKITAGPTQSCTRTIREDSWIQAAAGHMHLLGRSIRIELNPGTPRAQVIYDQPRYNFDDQGARKLPKAVRARAGDTMRVTCTHDATLRRQLPELATLKPRYVVWGEGTSDEMCLGVVVYTDRPAKGT